MRRKFAPAVVLILGFGTGMLALQLLLPDPSGAPAGGETKDLPEEPEGEWNSSLGSRPRFVDVTGAAGISFRHSNGSTGQRKYPEIMGAGVGLLDYDGDGFLDIYFVNGNHLLREPSPRLQNHLYHNNGDGTFTDVTGTAGVGHTGYGQGCAAGDYDNDGDPDLYVSNFGPDVLYRNNGNGTFTDVTEAAGLGNPNWGQSCSFLDYDGDGWLDLYVQNYLEYSLEKQRKAFGFFQGRKVLDYPSPLDYRGSPDRLYRNNGDGTFTDVTRETGLFRQGGKGMGCACLDFNDDGHIDLLVSNDLEENYLFLNRGDGTFQESALAAGVAFDGDGVPESSMGVSLGDFDRDGRIDMVIPCLRRQVFTLYRNLGDHFADVSERAGLAQSTSRQTGFNANFLDYDNDGDLDLFFTTGGVLRNELVPPEAPYVDQYGLPDLLLAGDGSGRYRDVSRWAGPHFRRRLIGRGSATGDLDNDGNLDIVINNLNGRAVILHNETRGGHWAILKLISTRGIRDALGASVWVEAGGIRQRSVVHGGVTYLSQIDRRIHIGLGRAGRIERLEVTWPGGERQVFEDLPGDRIMTIEQGVPSVK